MKLYSYRYLQELPHPNWWLVGIVLATLVLILFGLLYRMHGHGRERYRQLDIIAVVIVLLLAAIQVSRLNDRYQARQRQQQAVQLLQKAARQLHCSPTELSLSAAEPRSQLLLHDGRHHDNYLLLIGDTSHPQKFILAQTTLIHPRFHIEEGKS
ncbi:hypothetical protein IV38_GL001434 [Lactobacillus selangorensis]|uniref:DUF3290 domain-containing protein n=1 Tax=Lactobacillus selangorensis TaxID=81857 RepID=A0A0R2FIF2_9LACO|nr:DUF3290 family protein [Lactobacillus selangorensis]KRN28434.1 hypothetical protein IV38_GL001434 [Lactobacillus selangorensis]KRN31935.1 hypothetical protein IV40_GL001221 [Lactobacillus selangorensis]